MESMNHVANVSAQIAEHRLQWDVVAALKGGTAAMRLAGAKFLPIEPNEELVDWQARLDRTTLDNYFADGVQRIVSKVFAKELKFDELPQALALLIENWDNQQQNATQVASAVFDDAASYGIGYLLTDYPKLPEGTGFASFAAEKAAGRRPYEVRIDPLSVLDIRSSSFNGQERLSMFRYMEELSETLPDGSQALISQVREYRQRPLDNGTPGVVECVLYRKTDDSTEWYQFGEPTVLPLTAIPIAADYGKRSGFYLGKPPLWDLVEQNVAHWRLQSDLNNILHICNVPFILFKGFKKPVDKNGKEVENFEINIRKAIITANEQADVKWIEHAGATIKVAMDNLERLEKRMATRAMSISTPQPGGMTATATAINAAEANADLKKMALALQDALNAALYYQSLWLKLPTYGKVEVNTSFSNDFVSEATFDQVLTMYTAGLITRDTVISESKRRNILDLNQDVPPVTQTVTSTSNQAEEPAQAS